MKLSHREIKKNSITRLLHSLQGQRSGIHFLISFLKTSRESSSLILVGIKSHILGPKKDTLSLPLQTELTSGCNN